MTEVPYIDNLAGQNGLPADPRPDRRARGAVKLESDAFLARKKVLQKLKLRKQIPQAPKSTLNHPYVGDLERGGQDEGEKRDQRPPGAGGGCPGGTPPGDHPGGSPPGIPPRGSPQGTTQGMPPGDPPNPV